MIMRNSIVPPMCILSLGIGVLVGSAIFTQQEIVVSSPAPVQRQTNVYPVSGLDGKPMSPNSIHTAHGCMDLGHFTKDNGDVIALYLTGGSDPLWRNYPLCGNLTVSVLSYDDNDADGTYYFQTLTPDKIRRK